MKKDNAFDDKIDLYAGKIPEAEHKALREVVTNLDVCLVGVQAVFEKRATPEHAMEICKMVEARLLSAGSRRKRS